MYFKRLEIQGFKSFADKVTIDFNKGITCIVGPNGSGKSNVSDALRWVLGEQSPKTLRGGKMDEVIFNGTSSRHSKGMAEVTLVIDNSDGALKTPYSEVSITRRMFRDGNMEYLLNNNQVRLRDIRELIMDTGIGVDGYSIIGQGKIAEIVSEKPEARRAIFEESAGIVTYKTKKADAERKLADTEQNLNRLNDIISEIDGRIDGLREASAKAKRYLELRDRYKSLEVNIIVRQIDDFNKKQSIFTDELRSLDEEEAAKDKALRDISSDIEKLDAERADLEEKQGSLNEKLIDLTGRLASADKEDQYGRERLEQISAEEVRLSGEFETASRKVKVLTAEIANLEKEIGESEEASERAEAYSAECADNLDKLERESKEYTDLVNGRNEKLFALHNENLEKKSEVRSVESYLSSMKNRKAALLKEDAELEEKLSEQDARLKSSEADLNEARNGIDESRKAYREAAQKAETVKSDLARAADEVSRLTSKLNRMSARQGAMVEMENSYEGYNYPVKFIMGAKIRGVEGVVAELIDVPYGLETAVETALGGAKQNIVTADDASAKAAVAELKKRRAGRLTFLPVTSVRGREVQVPADIERARGYRGVASRLIKCDPRYDGIMTYLLGRVVIVEDLDSAIAFSKRNMPGARFVTLEGEVVNASGAITGGSFKSSGAVLLGRKNEIARLSDDMKKLKALLDDKQRNKGAIEAGLDRANSDMEKAKEAGRNSEFRVRALEEDIKRGKKDLEDTRARLESNEQELKSLEEQYAKSQEQAERLSGEGRDMEAEIEKINREIESASEDFDKKNQALEDARDELTSAKIEASTAQNKVKSLKGIAERVSGEREEHTARAEDAQTRLASLQDEKAGLTSKAKGNSEASQRLRSEKEAAEQALNGIIEGKGRLTDRYSGLTAKSDSLKNDISDIKDKKYQLNVRSVKGDEKLSALKDRLWTDFEISYAEALDMREEKFALSTAQKESREIRKEMAGLGDVNVSAIGEFERESKRLEFLTVQRSDVVEAAAELDKIIKETDSTIIRRFRKNFDDVNASFRKVFRQLFGGGSAELKMSDETDLLNSGVDIIAQPPGKKLQNINLMSGGEKTMTAIALIFAVLTVKPTPFCILDEVEAALDDENIVRFSDYLSNFSDTQFAVITHHKITMEKADVLYGITMPEHGVSKLLSLKLEEYDENEYTS
ncbi:MAG: chromosome segregation protein SMC [Eubacteriales bacterium]|nr:chromosome segregation protein SMC [Eubacteriales bacterium]